MNILIVSHNILSNSGNMGKTIKSFFLNIEDQCKISQVYFSSELPSDPICSDYFQITDKMVLFNFFSKKIIGNELQIDNKNIQNEHLSNNQIERFAERTKRTLRDIMWKLNFKKREKLYEWAKKMIPDIIFYASGNQSFSIDVALDLKRLLRVPLIVYSGDLYVNENPVSIFDFYQKRLNKMSDNLYKNTDYCFTATRKMSEFIKGRYKINSSPFYRQLTEVNKATSTPEFKNKAVYIGNLGLGRAKQLKDLSAVLLKSGINLDFYTLPRFKKEAQFLIKGGLKFKGTLEPNNIVPTYQKYEFVLHVESNNRKMIKLTKYSYSTKIPELLSSNRLIIAFGPKNIASMDEFHSYNSALCYFSINDAKNNFAEDLKNSETLNSIVENEKKHMKQHNSDIVKKNIRHALKTIFEKGQDK